MTRAGSIVGIGVLLCTACTLLTSTDGLSGGAFPPSEPDASDAATLSETSTPDAADAEAPGACNASHTFCDDFDRGSFAPGWSVEDGPGTLEFRSDTSTLGPSSLLGVVTGKAGGVSGRFLRHDFATNGSQTVTCAFDFRKDTVPTEALKIAALHVGSQMDAKGLAYGVYVGNGDGEISQYVEAESRSADVTVAKLGFAAGDWHHLVLVADASGVALSLDGTVVATNPYAMSFERKYFSFALGIVQLNDVSDEWRVRFDQLVCDVSP